MEITHPTLHLGSVISTLLWNLQTLAGNSKRARSDDEKIRDMILIIKNWTDTVSQTKFNRKMHFQEILDLKTTVDDTVNIVFT